MEIAGLEPTPAPGKIPHEGESLLSLLNATNANLHATDHISATELFNRRSVRQGDWKLVWQEPPYGTNGWQLYDLASDPAEINDVSKGNPIKHAELIALWQQYEQDKNVIIDPLLDLKYSSTNRHFEY